MTKLKTDYKDAAWTGNRVYKITDAGSGKSTIEDTTSYTVAGDRFGAKDINATNEAVNRLYATPVSATFKASAWAGSTAPYSQTVTVASITAEDEPTLVSMLADGATAAAQKAYQKAFAILAAGTGTTGNGTVTFKVYKKPATDITVGLKGA